MFPILQPLNVGKVGSFLGDYFITVVVVAVTIVVVLAALNLFPFELCKHDFFVIVVIDKIKNIKVSITNFQVLGDWDQGSHILFLCNFLDFCCWCSSILNRGDGRYGTAGNAGVSGAAIALL